MNELEQHAPTPISFHEKKEIPFSFLLTKACH